MVYFIDAQWREHYIEPLPFLAVIPPTPPPGLLNPLPIHSRTYPHYLLPVLLYQAAYNCWESRWFRRVTKLLNATRFHPDLFNPIYALACIAAPYDRYADFVSSLAFHTHLHSCLTAPATQHPTQRVRPWERLAHTVAFIYDYRLPRRSYVQRCIADLRDLQALGIDLAPPAVAAITAYYQQRSLNVLAHDYTQLRHHAPDVLCIALRDLLCYNSDSDSAHEGSME